MGAAGMSMLRVALLFGSVVIALAMLVVPMLDNGTRQTSYDRPIGLDTMTTSSVGGGKRYTIRRSVLQSSPDAVCIIHDNGAKSGDC